LQLGQFAPQKVDIDGRPARMDQSAGKPGDGSPEPPRLLEPAQGPGNVLPTGEQD
jgi:hypothetical protein